MTFKVSLRVWVGGSVVEHLPCLCGSQETPWHCGRKVCPKLYLWGQEITQASGAYHIPCIYTNLIWSPEVNGALSTSTCGSNTAVPEKHHIFQSKHWLVQPHPLSIESPFPKYLYATANLVWWNALGCGGLGYRHIDRANIVCLNYFHLVICIRASSTLHSQPSLSPFSEKWNTEECFQNHLGFVMWLTLNYFFIVVCSEPFYCCQVFFEISIWGFHPQFKKARLLNDLIYVK